MTLNSPELLARVAADTTWANPVNGRVSSVRTRADKTLVEHFEALADPDGVLSPQRRAQAGESRRKRYFIDRARFLAGRRRS